MKAAAGAFLDEYKKAGLNPAGVQAAASGWDAAQLLAAAVKKAGSTNGDAIRDALETMDYQGAVTHWRFAATDHTGQDKIRSPANGEVRQRGNEGRVPQRSRPDAAFAAGWKISRCSMAVCVALAPISFSIAEHSLTLVLGPNGAGKSSLLRALAGAVPVRGGRILLAGNDITAVPGVPAGQARHRAGARGPRPIADTHRSRQPDPRLDVRDTPARRAPHERRDGAHLPASSRVLRERLEQDCNTLSGGEMQIARHRPWPAGETACAAAR